MWNWLVGRAPTLDLLPEYWRAVAEHWNSIVWGTSPIAIILFAIWLSIAVPPMPLLITAFIWASLVAGYYAWRADHVRLLPRIGFAPEVFIETREARTINTGTIYPVNYVQLLPRCLTESAVENCRGHLLRVFVWSGQGWEPTPLNEPLDLIWSYRDSNPITLEPGIGQRLNLLAVTSNDVTLQAAQTPVVARNIFTINRDILFEVRVTGKNCPAIAHL